jgi:hypothetical protein
MIILLRKKKWHKSVAMFLLVTFVSQILYPVSALALTSGPSQPEIQSFEPVGTNQMVDPFTGDFTYNIPLFNLPGPNGGYPFNMAYHSGIGMDQEASWVGLGWNINVGSINRQKRNLPDEFDGTDKITITQGIKPNWTVGVGTQLDVELIGLEIKKLKLKQGLATFSLSASIFYNNYRGLGLDIGFGGSSKSSSGGEGFLDGGLMIHLNSQDGIGIEPSLSISGKMGKESKSFDVGLGVSTGYNSRQGLYGISLSANATKKQNATRTTKTESKKVTKKKFASIGASLGFAGASGSPSIGNGYVGNGFNAKFKMGVSVFGIFGNLTFEAYYRKQTMLNNYAPDVRSAIGYLHMEKTNPLKKGFLSTVMRKSNSHINSIRDVSREKDGMIYENSKRLPIPSINYDIFTVTGQGFAGMFRPHRNDIGMITPVHVVSSTVGDILGAEVGSVPTPNFGVNVGGIASAAVASGWDTGSENDAIEDVLNYKGEIINKLFEPYYYKAYGEMVASEMENIGSGDMYDFLKEEYPANIKLVKKGSILSRTFNMKRQLQSKKNGTSDIDELNTLNRKPRGTNIRAVKVGELINWEATDGNVYPTIPEYYTEYYQGDGNNYWLEQNFDKNSLLPYQHKNKTGYSNHIAMYIATSPDGQRYVYGLPAYNNEEVEEVVSVAPQPHCTKITNVPSSTDASSLAGDRFLMRKKTPAYAYAHLLTAVLGADYVDADNIPGPSDGDYGYWVKFNYAKMHDNLKWRAPFFGGNYLQGMETNDNDDKVAYVRGKKEVYYLATAETATHIAEFNLDNRPDALGANDEDVASDANNDYTVNKAWRASYRLESISLYSKNERFNKNGIRKEDATPIQTTHFDYSYELCQGIKNSFVENGGKLTLEKLYFTYKNNERGALSPYMFDYHESNPDYNEEKADRWGNYKSESNTQTCVIDAPYVDQYVDEEIHNQDASAWHLNNIKLPSGGEISVEYEADRYAYVQNEIAMQMTPIASMESLAGNASNISSAVKIEDAIGGNDMRIYFELEHPLPTSTSPDYLQRYITDDEDLYFKIRSEIKNNEFENIAGYANIDAVGFDDAIDGFYTHAYVQIARLSVDGKDTRYHPFLIAAWNFLRINNPNYIYGYTPSSDNFNTTEALRQLGSSFMSIKESLAELFNGFYDFMADKGWGAQIDLNNSFIRLRTPDKEKFGGGTRVHKVLMTDHWSESTNDEEKSNTYGQVYDYTMEENGETISSGVAEYEPLIGGDEIALRKPLRYHQEVPLKVDIDLFTEDPVNEELYPSASVGYRQVSVMSLASYYASLKPGNPEYNSAYQNIKSVTGKTTYEFYTAKEFPVKSEATNLYDRRNDDCTMCLFKSYIPIPLIGAIQRNIMAATQGYSIVLNDMHGKQKQITQYAQNETGDFIEDVPVNSVTYMYNRENNDNNTGDISSSVYVMFSDEDPFDETKAYFKKRDLGRESEMWVDSRKVRTGNYSSGLDYNTEIFYFFPGLYFWPSYSQSISEVKTVVTNKVIHKSGILTKTRVQNGESVVITENKCFDPLTGEPLLTTVTNDFEDPVYTYQMPARWQYEGMGAAYETDGATFGVTVTDVTNNEISLDVINFNGSNGSEVYNKLTPGATLMIVGFNYLTLNSIHGKSLKCSFKSENQHTQIRLPEGNFAYIAKVVEPGRTNQLQEKSGTIKSLIKDPTLGRRFVTSNEIMLPFGFVDFLNLALQDGPEGQFDMGHEYYFKNSPQECENLNLTGKKTCLTKFPELVEVFPTGFTTGSGTNTGGSACNGNNDQYIYNCVSQTTCAGYKSYTWHFKNGTKRIHTGIRWFFDNNRSTNSSTRNFHYIKKIEQINFTDFKVIYQPNGNSCEDPSEEIICLNGVDKFVYPGGTQTQSVNYGITVDKKSKLLTNNWEASRLLLYAKATSYKHLGNSNYWVLNKGFEYKDIRFGSKPNVAVNKDGTYDNDFYFYDYRKWGNLNWQLTNEITQYNNHGLPIEEKDALGNYSAVQYGYNDQLVVATAQNAKQGDIYFTSFEDVSEGYNYLSDFSYSGSHSRNFSIDCEDSESVSLILKHEFSPGKTYVVSAWYAHYVNYNKKEIILNARSTVDNSKIANTRMHAVGERLGYQKMEGLITVPAGNDPVHIELYSIGDYCVRIDDVRVYPEGSIMQAYVYNPVDWTLAATLDENNNATHYYYDEQGELFQVKRDTKHGKRTVQEIRKHIKE